MVWRVYHSIAATATARDRTVSSLQSNKHTSMAQTAAVTAAKAEQAAKRKASKLAAAALPCLCPPACACHAVGAHRRGDDVNDIAASRAKQPYGTGKPPPGGRCYRCRNKSAAASRVANYIPVKKPPRLSAVFSSPPAGGVQEESGIQYAAPPHEAAPRTMTTVFRNGGSMEPHDAHLRPPQLEPEQSTRPALPTQMELDASSGKGRKRQRADLLSREESEEEDEQDPEEAARVRPQGERADDEPEGEEEEAAVEEEAAPAGSSPAPGREGAEDEQEEAAVEDEHEEAAQLMQRRLVLRKDRRSSLEELQALDRKIASIRNGQAEKRLFRKAAVVAAGQAAVPVWKNLPMGRQVAGKPISWVPPGGAKGNECSECSFMTCRCLCDEPGYDGAPPWSGLSIGDPVPYGNQCARYLWAVKTGSMIFHARYKSSFSKTYTVTKEPGILVREEGGQSKVRAPTFVRLLDIVVWHDRPRRPPVRFEPAEIRTSASCSAAEVDGKFTSNLSLLVSMGPTVLV